MVAKAMAMIVALVIVAAAVAGRGASAAQCNAGNLLVCAPAIISGATPTATCCSNLRSQEGCFCQFARNPAYASYIKSDNARKTLAACHVSAPRC